MKKIFIVGILSVALFATSCDKMLDINENPNFPTASSADLSLSSAEVFVTSAVGGDLQLLGSVWSQFYAQHTGSNQYTGIDSYNLPNSSAYITRSWSLFYSGAIPDLQNSIEASAKDKEWGFWFMAQTLKAFSFHVLVDFYGEIPFSQATQGVGVNPVYDSGPTVNAGIIKMLDDAIAKEEEAKEANGFVVDSRLKSDLLLDGDIDTWVKFAKTLKLKILLRNYAANATAINALLVENDLLESDVKFDKFADVENNSNPLYESDRRKLNTPNNLRGSSTIIKYLNSKNDPRVGVYFEKAQGLYTGLPQGGYTLGSSWTPKTSRAMLGATDAVYLMSAVESYFLQAECFARAANKVKAKEMYDLGVTAAFDRWGLDATTFIATGGAYAFDEASQNSMLESIWRQKWIASVRSQAWDSFLEINRTGYPVYGTVNSENAAYVVGQLAPAINSVLPTGEYPRRLIYPKSSTDYNPNAPVSIPMQTKMWWHK